MLLHLCADFRAVLLRRKEKQNTFFPLLHLSFVKCLTLGDFQSDFVFISN